MTRRSQRQPPPVVPQSAAAWRLGEGGIREPSVAFWTTRRSSGFNRTDVYSSGTQSDGKACVLSLETEVGYDPELDQPIRLGKFPFRSHDDPAMNAGRNIDWDEFIGSHDYRYGVILRDMAVEKTALAIAEECGETYFHIRPLKEKLEVELREFLGDEAIADSVRVPSWRAGLHAERERAACH